MSMFRICNLLIIMEKKLTQTKSPSQFEKGPCFYSHSNAPFSADLLHEEVHNKKEYTRSAVFHFVFKIVFV